MDFIGRGRPRPELDLVLGLGVPGCKPRPVVMSYRPTKVFQVLMERALALVAGPRGEEDTQLLLETL